MVWGGITPKQKFGPVVFQNISQGWGNGVTAARYIDHMLRSHMFQRNNSRVHAARLAVRLSTNDILIFILPSLVLWSAKPGDRFRNKGKFYHLLYLDDLKILQTVRHFNENIGMA